MKLISYLNLDKLGSFIGYSILLRYDIIKCFLSGPSLGHNRISPGSYYCACGKDFTPFY